MDPGGEMKFWRWEKCQKEKQADQIEVKSDSSSPSEQNLKHPWVNKWMVFMAPNHPKIVKLFSWQKNNVSLFLEKQTTKENPNHKISQNPKQQHHNRFLGAKIILSASTRPRRLIRQIDQTWRLISVLAVMTLSWTCFSGGAWDVHPEIATASVLVFCYCFLFLRGDWRLFPKNRFCFPRVWNNK